MDVTWILWVRMSFCCFNSPNNPGTLQWKGLNLYSRGPGLKIATFEGSGFLGKEKFKKKHMFFPAILGKGIVENVGMVLKI